MRKHGDVNYELRNHLTEAKLNGHPHVQEKIDIADDDFDFEIESERAKVSRLAVDEPVTSPLVTLNSEDTRTVPESLEQACEAAGVNLDVLEGLGVVFKDLHTEYVQRILRRKKKDLTQKQLRGIKENLVKKTFRPKVPPAVRSCGGTPCFRFVIFPRWSVGSTP